MVQKSSEIQPPAEWSYLLDAEEVGSKPLKLSLSPNEAEKSALCKRLGIVAIEELKADLKLQRNSGNRVVHIEGVLKAKVKQKCIVTLEPVLEKMEEEFEGWFADPHQAVSFTKAKRERMSHKEKDEQPLLEENEDPEAIIDGKIDLGEFVTQHFSLCLNPYPRKEGAEYAVKQLEQEKEPEEGIYNNPFAALKDWKAKERKKDN